MTDKQIITDGSFIPMEEAIKAGLISEKDINVPSKRLDRIDKMEIDLASYEQMERDIEKIIEPYQLDWELDCLSLPSAIQSILERKEQECEELKANIHIDNNRMVKADKLKRIEDLIIACNSGYTDEFIQNLLVILHESEPCFESKLRQTLTEIKPILEYYANSTIGEKQEDGTYRIELSYKYGSSDMYGTPCYYKYNPKPARQALQKISEVLE